jgi:hypothetical protein
MAHIVNIDSLLFKDVLADIERFISIEGEVDLKDFNESSVVRRFTSAMAALYDQLRMKIDSTRRESVMHSAVRPESIRYLAQSQLAYHPKRKVAPQHPNLDAAGNPIRFRFHKPEGKLSRYDVLGNLSIDGESYPVSMISDYEMLDETTVSCRLGIGSWRRFDIRLNDNLGHFDPYHVFHVDEDRGSIDDSGTVHLVLREKIEGGDETDDIYKETIKPIITNHLYEVSNYREDEKHKLVLVTSNYYGGLDINFGDGVIFGNVLYQETALDVVEVHYFVTPGFIPNLNFISDNVSWDSNFVDEELHGYVFNQNMANGINEESVAQIKTLSPYVAMSNNRIMTNDDFISRVRRIPQIKSCASRPRHINPPKDFCEGGGSVSDLVPTATFELTGLASGSGVDTSKANEWEAPIEDTVEDTVEDGGEDSISDTDCVIWPKGTVISEGGRFWVALRNIGRIDNYPLLTEWNIPPSEQQGVVDGDRTYYLWQEVDTEFHPITQLDWDLNYHQQYNFDTLLGFMRVRILPPVRVDMELELVIVSKRNLDINARSHNEINEVIREIVHGYCWELGVFLDFGKMLSDIINIREVRHCYIQKSMLYENKHGNNGVITKIELKQAAFTNTPFDTDHYIHPSKLDIKYQESSLKGNRYGSNNVPFEVD